MDEPPAIRLSDYFPRESESIEDRLRRWHDRDVEIGAEVESRATQELIEENLRLKREMRHPWIPAERYARHRLGQVRRRLISRRVASGR